MKQRLLDVLNEYSWREFERSMFESVDEIPTVISLAWTTVGDDNEYEIQCNFNIEKLQWEEYVNGELVIVERRDSIEDFIAEIECCDFNDIIRDVYGIALQMEA